ncbi:gliding motility lipoprotein GldB [Roseivirga sp. BDSF3-8]|uniref:gliding motility lipoprotein GldB n=1 Tax=Roseivirga sp. BDSF3-8 TaxID=3241598 RepID=UPI003531890C
MKTVSVKNTILAVISYFLFFSCGGGGNESCREQPDIDNISINVEIERLDRAIFQAESAAEINRIMKKNPVLAGYYLPEAAIAGDTSTLADLYAMVNDESLDTLYQETQSIFGEMEELEEEYTRAFKNFKYYIPGFNPPEVKAMVTGLAGYADLYVSDTLLLVGADYFLGPKATYRPVNTPQYMMRRYTSDYIVPSSLLFLSQSYNSVDESNNSLLADMIYYGKSYYMVSVAMPCLPDSTLMGYTSREMEGVKFNKEQIWKHFIDNNLLYETNHFTKTKYTGERPNTFEISNEAPGRVGIWLGLDIVRQYMDKNPDVSVEELMRTADVQQIFEQSRYRPDRD